jgi:hypothetical protein
LVYPAAGILALTFDEVIIKALLILATKLEQAYVHKTRTRRPRTSLGLHCHRLSSSRRPWHQKEWDARVLGIVWALPWLSLGLIVVLGLG